MRQFDVPVFYRSPIISTVKDARKATDPRKKDFAPSVIDFGPVRFKIARHFGFCYGVEQAIEIAYQTLDDHPDRRIFLLSEMIHNPHVNNDLEERGVQFLRSTTGEQLIPFDVLTPDDIVLIPAFGTTLEVEKTLEARGVDTQSYDTTCPFVEKVWRKSRQIGGDDYTIVVHGKRYHEETRATFSHAKEHGPVVVVRNMEEAEDLARVIRGDASADFFETRFADRYSEGFDPATDLQRLGVVNQTTMLATETKAISNLLREALEARYGTAEIKEHFADTSDTLCYATNENQDATLALINDGADLAIVVGGYNSSNTSHLVELCEEHMPTYFISDAQQFDGPAEIQHFDLHAEAVVTTAHWFPVDDTPVDVILNSGASCPDALLDEVIRAIISWYPEARPVDEALAPFRADAAEA
ncbi:4-hydroxy-3-methylbut-2-enyl diphosphate reductase [Salisaeta longa]|uniref:4-hydroxy-3-methylbut-2-enyl diphosphate reductase n=1 Tax=Salisaeta longa TaxID=503170 RepID=UPI0003B5DE50|nr:4-hydroxy-3-methylbut-2-enyl diphosphate reductase [Salisaeta longa]